MSLSFSEFVSKAQRSACSRCDDYCMSGNLPGRDGAGEREIKSYGPAKMLMESESRVLALQENTVARGADKVYNGINMQCSFGEGREIEYL